MNKKLGHDAIYDARELGVPRMLLLGLQHLFAMFGATVLVPILVQGYGLPLSIQTTLLFAGLGTLLFHQAEGPCLPGLVLCVSGRLPGHGDPQRRKVRHHVRQ
jgi:xanthine/uracil permease